jgi:hypothetical protein
VSGGGSRAARIAGLAAGALLAVLSFELVLRQIYWMPTTHHPRFGLVPVDGAVVRYCREGCGTSRWSADGLRRASAPDPDRAAILVLGDSFTESMMTDDRRVFPQLAESQLAERGARWQLLNVGRSGAAPPGYVALAPLYAELYGARWTVIQLRSPDLESDAWDPARTHFARAEGGALLAVEVPPRPSRVSQAVAPLRRGSALLNLGLLRMREFAEAARAEPPLFRSQLAAPAADAPAWSYPVEAEVEALAAAYAGRVTFLFLPHFDARNPDRRDETEARFTATCASRALRCVNLRERFPAFRDRHASPYGFANSQFNSGHMNDAGHAAAAELLRDEILELTALDLL